VKLEKYQLRGSLGVLIQKSVRVDQKKDQLKVELCFYFRLNSKISRWMLFSYIELISYSLITSSKSVIFSFLRVSFVPSKIDLYLSGKVWESLVPRVSELLE